MGGVNAKLTPDEVDALKKDTRFSEEEIRQWYQGFRHDCPSGKVNKGDFDRIYRSFFPFGDSSKFCSHVFQLFDLNGDGTLDFREFLLAVNIMLTDDADERLRFIFRIYDVDSSGQITKQEMYEIFKSLNRMLAAQSQGYRTEDELKTALEQVYTVMDFDQSDSITIDEFIVAAKKDPNIYSILDATIRPF